MLLMPILSPVFASSNVNSQIKVNGYRINCNSSVWRNKDICKGKTTTKQRKKKRPALLTTTGADAYDLPDGGVEGQLKIISMKVNGGNGTVTPDNFVNGTQILFNNVEDTITLLWQSTGWVVLARQNATVT